MSRSEATVLIIDSYAAKKLNQRFILMLLVLTSPSLNNSPGRRFKRRHGQLVRLRFQKRGI